MKNKRGLHKERRRLQKTKLNLKLTGLGTVAWAILAREKCGYLKVRRNSHPDSCELKSQANFPRAKITHATAPWNQYF